MTILNWNDILQCVDTTEIISPLHICQPQIMQSVACGEWPVVEALASNARDINKVLPRPCAYSNTIYLIFGAVANDRRRENGLPRIKDAIQVLERAPHVTRDINLAVAHVCAFVMLYERPAYHIPGNTRMIVHAQYEQPPVDIVPELISHLTQAGSLLEKARASYAAKGDNERARFAAELLEWVEGWVDRLVSSGLVVNCRTW
jgi:hypothetical protein